MYVGEIAFVVLTRDQWFGYSGILQKGPLFWYVNGARVIPARTSDRRRGCCRYDYVKYSVEKISMYPKPIEHKRPN
jgi:hypothetical protein